MKTLSALAREKKWVLDEFNSLGITPASLLRGDPFARLLLRLTHGSLWRAIWITFGVYAVGVIALGAAISYAYAQAGFKFLAVWELSNFIIVLWEQVAFPIIWMFYLWQVFGIVGVYRQFAENGVYALRAESTRFQDFFRSALQSPLNRRLNLALALLLTIGGAIFWYWAAIIPISSSAFAFGAPTIWYVINPFYFWLIWMPLAFANVYITIWIVLRGVIAIAAFARFFQLFRVDPQPFHPDRCNGMASIGGYAIRTGLLVVLFGIGVSTTIAYPMLFGQAINLDPAAVLMLTLYVIVVPILLILPVWEAHTAMVKAKANALEQVAVQIRKLLAGPRTHNGENSIELIEQLEKKYQIIERAYHTWPFQIGSLVRFGAAAGSPLLSTGVSFLIDLLIQR